MLDKAIENAALMLAGKVKASCVYREYEVQLQNIKEYPELYEKVNEFRVEKYELQTMEPAEGLLEKIDIFERKYEEIIENPIVNDFLRAELAFCRMMQEVDIYIAKELNFE